MFEVTPFSEEHFCGEYLKGAVVCKDTLGNVHILTKDDTLLDVSANPDLHLLLSDIKGYLQLDGTYLKNALPVVNKYGTNLVNRKIDPRVAVISSKPVLRVKIDPRMHVLGIFLVYKVSPTVEYKQVMFQGKTWKYEERSATQVGIQGAVKLLEDLRSGLLDHYWMEYPKIGTGITPFISVQAVTTLTDKIEVLLQSLDII